MLNNINSLYRWVIYLFIYLFKNSTQ